MKQVTRSALVNHSAERMFELIDDVAAYPEFLPWCQQSDILSNTHEEMVARLTLSKSHIKQSFTTRNKKQFPDKILLSLVDGPFKHLAGVWSFQALGDNACKVSLNLEFDVLNPVIAVALNPIFSHAANTMVDAFCQRADEVYG